MRGDKTCDLKAFRKEHGLRALSFASAGDLEAILGLLPGAVTPLGLLNDEARQVKFFLDRDFLKPPGLAGVHPNENTATVWLHPEDLMAVIQAHGNEAERVDI